MKKILITGGAGYIGSHVVKLFLEKNYEVIVFDNLSHGFKEPMKILSKFGKLKFTEGDLITKSAIEKVFKSNKIYLVIHFAALCSVNESMEKPELYFENNVLGTLNLVKAMRKFNVKNIIFSSTCETYGETNGKAIDENYHQNPSNPYGESKLMAEKIIEWYSKIYNLNYVIFRYFNVCGADKNGIIGDSKKPSQLLVQNAVRGAMGIEPFFYTCAKVNTPDETPIRDYIDVEDLANAHYSAYIYLKRGGKSEIFNLGNGKGYSVKQIVNEIEKKFKKSIQKKCGKIRKGENAKIFADSRKANRILRWKPKKNIEESIESLKKWYTNFPKGYKN